jgi:hypothetical protein
MRPSPVHGVAMVKGCAPSSAWKVTKANWPAWCPVQRPLMSIASSSVCTASCRVMADTSPTALRPAATRRSSTRTAAMPPPAPAAPGQPQHTGPVIHAHQHQRMPGQGQEGCGQQAMHLEEVAVREGAHQRQHHHQHGQRTPTRHHHGQAAPRSACCSHSSAGRSVQQAGRHGLAPTPVPPAATAPRPAASVRGTPRVP